MATLKMKNQINVSCKALKAASSMRRVCILLLMPSFCLGCSSFPTTRGTWVGKVQSRTFYGYDGPQQCNAAMIHALNGPNLPIDVGYDLFLADKDNHLIDPATFSDNQYIWVTGDAGLAAVGDAKGTMANSVGDSLGAAESTILVSRIVDAKTGLVIKPQLAVMKRH